ncbi:MAG: hypothetical protein ACOX51_00880 [Myxococcota bacterium]|jgi:TolB protein|nr:hypothetical protein [Myxococcota bacterium]HON25703.1 hypothetical protein [Myxococcota bacterium]HOS61340.1 hypothetical protein [Myxococcota bacterium]HPC91409.1 hypothetical protein [Myxococcota bacterium]HPL24507.1 hypothetical protein [Myxococcota bacterium]
MFKQRMMLCLLLAVGFLGPRFVYSQEASPEAPAEVDQSIHVVVGPSARALDPVAIADFECSSDKSVCKEANKVLDRDLTLSGFFKILDRSSFLGDPSAEGLGAPVWSSWFNIGAHYLIKGQITAKGKAYNCEFRLYNINDKKFVSVKGESQYAVPKEGLRRAVHTFANGVIEAITGSPGIFGSRILVTRKKSNNERVIESMEMDGAGLTTQVANGSINMFPRSSRKGILYTSYLSGIPQLYVGKKRITNDDREYRGAEFSPNGKKIVASVDIDGQSDLVILDGETGKEELRLTDSEWDEVSPSWSPDGSKIVFVSSKNGHPQVHIINADGTGERRLTMAGNYNVNPRFGPKGLIVFAGMDEFVLDLFTVDLSGNMTRLTQGQGSNKDPCWSPDGRYLAFVSDRAGKWKVWIMSQDGRYQFPITDKVDTWAQIDWR